ncbi:hypothetical protein AVEN_264786-1 [Araneus ventricosus]|uniref:Uncharacterized protein n=1 Tax=Araneus ventricosus TaxID=182803 RepID=A0A4Y2AJH7_ARAVE|nr:hypothetical protein AVEN_264786-1 [Araneus ventricosus]
MEVRYIEIANTWKFDIQRLPIHGSSIYGDSTVVTVTYATLHLKCLCGHTDTNVGGENNNLGEMESLGMTTDAPPEIFDAWKFDIQRLPIHGSSIYRDCRYMEVRYTEINDIWKFDIQRLPIHGSSIYKDCRYMGVRYIGILL